jgi:hypothetical protein
VIRAFRRTRLGARLSAATLGCFLSLSIAAFFHNDVDDAICNAAPVVHDHAAHRLVAGSDSTRAPEHCFTCHWTSLRTVQSATEFEAPAIESRGLAVDADAGLTFGTAASQPARAPPVA